jgi:hypothetical protein
MDTRGATKEEWSMISAATFFQFWASAYKEMLDGCLKNPEPRIWHALWV